MATTNKAFRVKTGLIVEGAELKPAAGTTTYPPILLTSGTNLTTATAGAFEYDGTNFYLTPTAGNRKTVAFTDLIPAAGTSTVLGTIKLASDTAQTVAFNTVSATASRSYGLQVNASGQGIVNVPWTDTVYTLPTATASALGGIELFSGTTQSVAANAVTTTASRTYGLQLNSDLQGVVNVPWTDTDTNWYPTTFAYTGGTTAGPTGSLTGSGMSAVSFGAIPSASASASGIVTTGAQEFAGVKTLTSPSITTSLTTTSTTFAIANTTATTVNFAGAATAVNIGAATGDTTVNNNLVVTGNLTVNGTTTTVNSTTVTVDDIVLELGAVTSPTDTTANGGGISLLGATNKTILWDSANTNWTSSENWNLASGKVFKINNASTLSATTLGSAVVNSSLTKVGALSGGTAGFVKVDASGNLTSDSTTYLTAASPALTGTPTLDSNAGFIAKSGSTTGTTALTLNSIYSVSTYNGGEFIIKATNASNIEITKVLAITDGTNVYLTTYGDVYVSADLVTVDFAYAGSNVNMVITPVAGTTGTTSVKVSGTLLAV